MTRKVLREAAWFALFAGAAVAMTWPLAVRLTTAVSDLGDPLLNTWILDWTAHALVHQPLHLFDAPIFHPSHLPLAFSEHLAGIAIFVLPLHLAGLPPVAVYNVAMLLGFALSGYGAFVLARMFTGNLAAAAIAGFFYAFVPFRFDHLAHLQVVSGGWVPLILAALVAYWRVPSRRNAALLGAAFVMNGLTNVYYLLFAAAAIGVTMLFLAAAAPARDRLFWLRLFAALAIAGVLLLPFLIPYKIVSDEYHMTRSEGELRDSSPSWHAWLAARDRSRLWGPLTPPAWMLHERLLFPGIVAPLLLLAALLLRRRRASQDGPPRAAVRRRWLDALIVLSALLAVLTLAIDRPMLRIAGHVVFAMRGADVPLTALAVLLMFRLPLRRWLARSRFSTDEWIALVWLVVGFLGSLGMNTFFFEFLFRRVFVFESIRAPGRFAVIAYAALAAFAAIGATELIRRRRIFAPLLIAAIVVDLLPVIRWEHLPEKQAPVYVWMSRNDAAPILELPIVGWWEAGYLIGSTLHRRASLNGTSGWEPPFHRDLRLAWEGGRFDEMLDLAESAGARLLVVHAHRLQDRGYAAALRAAVDSGRLAFLRRFDHGVEGDFAFAFTRNLEQWRAFRAPDVPDGAGDLPAQMLTRFFEGRPTYNTTPFGRVERPGYDETVTGALVVEGWAIAPAFVREVRLLFEDGRVAYTAERVDRGDVTAAYPWYYQGKPGFRLEFPARPRNIPWRTDLQVEIVDSNGAVTRLDDVPFEWK